MRYVLYGLRLEANLAVPGLEGSPTSGPGADLRVYLGEMPPWLGDLLACTWQSRYVSPRSDPGASPTLQVWHASASGWFRFRYGDGTEFLLDAAGREVWSTWPPPLTIEDTATYLLGPVLGFVLRLRGVTCLHASAVRIGDHAVALAGPVGAGKSTTAAMLARLGYAIVTEDVLPLGDNDGQIFVQPGYPRIRLWDSSVEALYGAPEALPHLTPNWDKRYLDLGTGGGNFQREALPLAAVYLLGERQNGPEVPRVEPLTPSSALMALVTHAYSNYLLDSAMRAHEFEVLSRLVRTVPVRRLIVPSTLADLRRTCQALLSNYAAHRPA